MATNETDNRKPSEQAAPSQQASSSGHAQPKPEQPPKTKPQPPRLKLVTPSGKQLGDAPSPLPEPEETKA
ncbi:hypothetical protein SAMN05216241_106117 [Limimonas halophila]|uniref:Uncharacterized protein n=1 Tax=Limimonas halophila TaxID=1082479 RepID=A0A1G7S4G8_9PROT|nr:hypothetical protein [Limimonas halophila]SDG17917.1 hypothetical protein SAMN05216241_106117 [Limimonas halophila]